MICKKRMKRCITQFTGLAMGLAMGLMFSMNAMAASRHVATFAGVEMRAVSAVSDKLGYGYTACMDYSPTVTVKIKGTYTYVHPITGEYGSYSSGWIEGASSVSITYSAPDGYRSYSMQCDHEATYETQYWSCSTVKELEAIEPIEP